MASEEKKDVTLEELDKKITYFTIVIVFLITFYFVFLIQQL
jgi:hypothetical protein